MEDTNLTMEWSKFDHEKGYEKTQQDVKLKNGDIITNCWPNAGYWSVLEKQIISKYNGKAISIPVSDTDEVRLTHSEDQSWRK